MSARSEKERSKKRSKAELEEQARIFLAPLAEEFVQGLARVRMFPNESELFTDVMQRLPNLHEGAREIAMGLLVGLNYWMQEEGDKQALKEAVKRGEIKVPVGTYDLLEELFQQHVIGDPYLREYQTGIAGGIVSLSRGARIENGQAVVVPEMNLAVHLDLKQDGHNTGMATLRACIGEGDRLLSLGSSLNSGAVSARMRTPKFDLQSMMGYMREAFDLPK